MGDGMNDVNYVSVGVGAAALGWGIFSVYLRIKDPYRLGKLAAMQKALGGAAGTALHFISYTLLPLAVGIVFIALGLQGKSIF